MQACRPSAVRARFSARILAFLLLSISLLSTTQADIATQWIEAQSLTDGRLATAVEPASPYQATAEALLALDGQSPVSTPATSYLAAQAFITTESLARRLAIAVKTGTATDTLVAGLLALQNADGGFGETRGYHSTALDTALALDALAIAGHRSTAPAIRALEYLLSVQSADGGYQPAAGEPGAAYVTAGVLRALNHYRTDYNINATISRAIAFLDAERQADGTWRDHWETATALLALAPAGADPLLLTRAADALRAGQQANGSWDDSVYVTALAMRALRALEDMPPPPPVNEGAVSGRVLDANNGQPVIGATLRTSTGLETTAGVDGSFALSGLSAGSHVIDITATGYNPLNMTVSVNAAGTAVLGNVLLTPMPDTGFIRGVVSRAADGVPIQGATVTVSGASVTATQSDAEGRFALSAAPGTLGITVTADGYEPVNASGTLTAGAALWFTPMMLETGAPAPAPEVSVQGTVVDNATGGPLAGVTVTVTNGAHAWNTVTDASGAFTLTGIDAGEETITLAKTGYQSQIYTAVAGPGNTVALGTVRLAHETVTRSSTITGRLLDADSGSPIAGASIVIAETGSNAISAVDGAYTIEAITLTRFTLQASAPGYVSTSGVVELAQYGTATVNVQMHRVAAADFDVLQVETDADHYPALTKVKIQATVGNSGADPRTVVLQTSVIDSAGRVIEQFPAVRIPAGGNPQDAWVTVAAGEQLPVPMEWNTDRYTAGQYRLVVEAVEVASSRVLGQRAAVVNIDPTRRIGGSASFDPPIAQLAAKQPIQVASLLSNQGNEPIGPAMATARVTLQKEGYRPRSDLMDIKTVVTDDALANAKGMALGPDGNFYIGDSAGRRILRVFPSGEIETFADNVLFPVDVDVAQGKVYALRSNGVVEEFDMNANRVTHATGLPSTLTLKVLDDGRMLIGTKGGAMYERATDGRLRMLSGAGLSTPHGLVEGADGDLIIADASQNALVRYAHGRLTPFVNNITQPYGLAADAANNLYVTAFGSNELYRVDTAGQAAVVADGLSGPYDVKLRQDGVAVVSNNNGSSIVAVAPDGTVTPLVERTTSHPTAAAYDPAGTLYLANNGFSNIVAVSPDGRFTEFKTGIAGINAMSPSADGGLVVLNTSGSLTSLSAQGDSQTLATGLSGARDLAPSGDGGWLVAQTTGPRIAKVAADGTVSTHVAQVISTPRAVRAMDDGSVYILSSSGMVAHIAPDGRAGIVASGLNAPYGLAVDTAGDIYVSETTQKRIARVSAAGEITRTSVAFSPGALAFLPDGSLLAAEWNSRIIHRMDPAGEWSQFAQTDYAIRYDMLADADGTVWVPHYSYRSVTRIAPDGSRTQHQLPSSAPFSVSPDGTGGIYVASYGRIAQISSAGVVSTAFAHPVLNNQYQYGVVRMPDGGFTTIDNTGKVSRFDAAGNLSGRYASLQSPLAMTRVADDLLVSVSGMVLRFRDPSKLGEIVTTGYYVRLAAEPSGAVLMATAANVSRLSADLSGVQTLATGYSNIQGLSASPSGTFVVADYAANRLGFHASSGTLIDSYYGLVNPKGLLIDGNGDLLVVNSLPAGIMKVRSDGKLSLFHTRSGLERMMLDTDGSILVAGSGNIYRLNANGGLLQTHKVTSPLDLVRTRDGALYTTASNGRLFAIDGNWAERQVASGLNSPSDIALDGNGKVYVTDANRGVVTRLGEYGAIELVSAGLSQARALLFDDSDALHVAYGTGQVAIIAPDGTRTELPAPPRVGPFTALARTAGRDVHALAPNQRSLLQLMLSPTSVTQPGQVVYSGSASISGLGLDGAAVSVDFGEWVPELAGDYLLEVQLADNAVGGTLRNTLHVGPNAEATLSLDRNDVLPGDRSVSGQLTVIGADSTSITQIDPAGATLAASSYAYGRAIAADSKGNIFAADTNRIVKITPDGQLSDFITGISVGNGMAVDSDDFLYTVSGGNIAKLSPDGTVVAQYVVPGTAQAVALDYADTLYAVTSSNVLLRIDQTDGSHQTVTSVGLNGPRGLTIDAYGYFYVLNSANTIIRITPDGSSTTLYFDEARFEYEGVNVVADCANNLLFAPISLPPFKTGGEEDIIVQLVGDTGEVRQILYGPSIDRTLTDIDVLFYDRFGRRLLMWGDVYGGKIFSFPLKCGGIDAEAHVVARADVDLSSTDPAPDQTLPREDGLVEYVWSLEEVDHRGSTIAMNLLFQGLQEGETRPMLQEAFLAYDNSFAPGETITVPIPIPGLLASSRMGITPLLPGDSFGPDTLLPITARVENGGELPFDGSVELGILDGRGQVVEALPPIPVDQLAGVTSGDFTAQWNTGATFSGDYAVQARLLNAAGTEVATGITPFNIVIGSAPGTSLIGLSLTSDRAIYQAWDNADLSIAVTNNGTNANSSTGTVDLQVRDPAGTIIHTASYPVPEMLPGGRNAHADHLALVDAPAGQYAVTAVVHDATGQELARTTVGFVVERSAVQALQGSVQVQHDRIEPGMTNTCTETITNRGAAALTGVTIRHRLVNLDSGEVVAETSRVVDIAGGEAISSTEVVDSITLPAGGYACLLSTEIAGNTADLARETFQVIEPPVRIEGDMQLGDQGRLLVLLDGHRREKSHERDDDHHAAHAHPICVAETQLSLATAYGQPLAIGSRLDVELLDRHGTLLDSEWAEVRTEVSNANRHAGSSRMDLAIDHLDATRLELAVAYDGNGNGCPSLPVVVRLAVWQDDALLPVSDEEEHAPNGLLLRELQLTAANDDDAVDDADDTLDAPSPAERRAYLESLLDDAGWSYTIVTDGEAFARELRSGGYLSYAILSDREKLSEQVQKELREAVYRGEGLLVAGNHDARNGRLDEPLGIRYQGKPTGVSGIHFVAPTFQLEGEHAFVVKEQAVRIRLDGAEAVARYLASSRGHGHDTHHKTDQDRHDDGDDHGHDRDDCSPGKQSQHDARKDKSSHAHDRQDDDVHCDALSQAGADAAVTIHDYGQGRSVYTGFDLLVQAAAGDEASVFEQLLLQALAHIQPQPLPTVAGGVVPVRIHLVNQGSEVPVRLLVALPVGSAAIHAPGADTLADGRLSWNLILTEQAEATFEFWVRLPEMAGPVMIDALIQTDQAGSYVDHEALSLSLSIDEAVMPQLRAELDAMDGKDYRKVRQEVEKADDYLARGRIEQALKHLVHAAGLLGRLPGDEAAALRLEAAKAIREADLRGGG